MVFKWDIIIQFQNLFWFEILSTDTSSSQNAPKALLIDMALPVMAFSVFKGALYGAVLTI